MSRMVDSTGPAAEEAKIVDSNPRDTLRSDPVAHAFLVVAVRLLCAGRSCWLDWREATSLRWWERRDVSSGSFTAAFQAFELSKGWGQASPPT